MLIPRSTRGRKSPGRIDIDRALIDALDLTSRTRVVLKSLGIVDSEQLVKLTGAQLKTACEVEVAEVWREITDVLAGLGYDTSKRQDYLW